jgi:hypothetical protein
MSEKYAVGEIVDITIKGARVVGNASHNGFMTVSYLVDDPASHHDALGPARAQAPIQEGYAVTVDRVAPAEWPPRVGDIWGMRGGSRFVCVRDFNAPAGYEVALVNVADGSERYMPHELRPEELLYRENEQNPPTCAECDTPTAAQDGGSR